MRGRRQEEATDDDLDVLRIIVTCTCVGASFWVNRQIYVHAVLT